MDVMTIVLVVAGAARVAAAVVMEAEVIGAGVVMADAEAMIVVLAAMLLAGSSSVGTPVHLVIRMLLRPRNELRVLRVKTDVVTTSLARRRAPVLRDRRVPANCVWF